MYRSTTIILFSVAVFFSNCNSKIVTQKTNSLTTSATNLIDKNATAETKTLALNLKELSKSHTLFGHQHATQYGHGWSGDADRSDVKSVTGSHPAVIGVDFSGFTTGTAEDV